jgi:hypothetical protein
LVFAIIDEVVAMVTHWNKISLASPYLIDVQSDVDEWPVRI